MNIFNYNYKKAEILINFLSIVSLILMMFFYVFHHRYGYIHVQNYTIFLFTFFNLIRIFFFKIDNRFFFYLIISFILIIIHLLFFSNINEINIVKFFRYYFFCILFFSIGFLSKDNLIFFFECLLITTLITFIFGLIIFLVFPKFISLIDYNNVYRLKFFFSEPSALAPFCGILTIYALRNNNLFVFLVALIVVVLSYSVINFIVVLCSTLYSINKKNILYISIIAFLFIAYLLFIGENEILLNRLVGLFKSLPIYGGEVSIKDSLTSINARTRDLYEIFLILKNEDILLTGYGLNQFVFSDEGVNSFSLLHHFFLSFGIPGIFSILFFSFMIILKFRNTLYSYLFPFVIYAMINSAQGLLLQGVWFIALACLIQIDNLKKNY